MDCEFIFTRDFKYISFIHDSLYSYNLSKTGGERRADVHATENPDSAAIIVCDKAGKCYGGAAYHWENSPRHIFVDYIFIDDALRGHNIGSRLIEILETRVRGEGAENITLTTNTFQAPGFYRKMGFVETACKAYPAKLCPENKQYTFVKDLRKN